MHCKNVSAHHCSLAGNGVLFCKASHVQKNKKVDELLACYRHCTNNFVTSFDFLHTVYLSLMPFQ